MPEATRTRLFPLFADLRGRGVLVVGGGAAAGRKLEPLPGAGAEVVVGAPADQPGLAEWMRGERIEQQELETLRAHGIACEVVPGITAAIACGACADLDALDQGRAGARGPDPGLLHRGGWARTRRRAADPSRAAGLDPVRARGGWQPPGAAGGDRHAGRPASACAFPRSTRPPRRWWSLRWPQSPAPCTGSVPPPDRRALNRAGCSIARAPAAA